MKALSKVLVLGFFTHVAIAAPKQEMAMDKMAHLPSFYVDKR